MLAMMWAIWEGTHRQSGYTPLMCAVAAGRVENTRLLLQAGADVNRVNEYQETVVHMTKCMQ
mgnify:CR=1 FL=1